MGHNLEYWKKKKPAWEQQIQLGDDYILEPEGIFYYRHLARLPGYHGLGSKLEDALHELVQEKGYLKIICEIAKNPWNEASQRMHARRGYTEIGEVEYGDSILWGVYEKVL